jgi:DNA repair protein RadC
MDKYAKTVAAKNTLRSTVLTDVYEVGRFCCTHFGNNPIEVLNMIVLDSSSKVKNIIKVSEGNVRSTSASLEKVLMLAIKHKACGVILCHNHPGGNLEISNADKTMTYKIAASLRTLDIPLVDHIICCDDKFESMRQRCMILY